MERREIQGKQAHDRDANNDDTTKRRRFASVSVPGALIVGAGPSGLAAAACLSSRGVPSLVLEQSDRIAPLWQLRTYDRLRLHLPRRFCELPLLNFPTTFPSYPTKHQFVAYLESYAARFRIRPRFGESVEAAEFDHALRRWRVTTAGTEYVARFLVVATGENAEAAVPEIEGMGGFTGRVRHTCRYRSGEEFRGEKVLVVGCGNSGMEVCLDLCNYHAQPSLVVRDTVHVLPREMLGMSTFGLSMWLLKWVPIRVVDWFLLLVSWFVFGDTARFGLNRPKLGPLRLKNLTGKTPVLDVGTLAKIKSGHVKICSGIKRLKHDTVEFTNGKSEKFDSIILATGYKSNVPYWLKDRKMFSEVDGFPRKEFPEGWKGECGLYAVGFTKRGLLGTSLDAQRIARDIEVCWKQEANHQSSTR